jgi:nitrogen-specific signal transduction histidine kinase
VTAVNGQDAKSDSGDGFAARMLASMTSGVLGIDAEGRIALCNEAATRILGRGEAVALERGRDCGQALRHQPAVARLLLEALGGRGPLSRAELVLEAVGGAAARTIGFTIGAVRDSAGRPCGAAMIFRDLAPIERRGEQERLRDRLAALGQMASGMAHEIRNPLAGMEVLAGLLSRRLCDRPEERALVAELTGELRAVADTVTASLDFVRPVVPAREAVAAAPLVEEAIALVLARIPFEGCIESRYDASTPPLLGDAEQLRAVVVNLAENALEAMDGLPGGRLGLDVRPVAGVGDGGSTEVVIAVSDTGPGVRPELREKVFHPFFTTRERGSGVGLATAQKIVVSHGGRLELESRPAGGCTFRVSIPAAEAAG